MRRGRKRKFRGTTLRNPEKRPDDRLMVLNQPHRRWLPEAVRASEKAASMLGCLNLKKLISDELCEAGRLYAVAASAYRGMIGTPAGLGSSGTGRGCNPVGCPPEQCRCLKITADYLSARFALASAGERSMAVVEKLIFDDLWPINMAEATCGLIKLRDHYGLTSGGDSSNRRNT